MERRESAEISARKKSIVGILSNVAELGASRMEETIGNASLRDAAIGTGIAVDKMLAQQVKPQQLLCKWFCLHLKSRRNAGHAMQGWMR